MLCINDKMGTLEQLEFQGTVIYTYIEIRPSGHTFSLYGNET